MKIVKVHLGKRSYNIYIDEGAIRKLPSLVKPKAPDTPLFIVTNRKINRLHGRTLRKILEPLSNKILFFEVPDGEQAKSFPIYVRTMKRVARFARKTKPILFAFGGGVVGDLTGFVASTYRRGVPYIQIPTTLLAQVDSAIGGKVAIDIKEAKNIVGDFYQPKAVICDLRFLKTLPKKELQNGLVEIIKCGIIKERSLFAFLEKNLNKILNAEIKSLGYVVFRASSIKAKVVERDEFDTKDIRAILNFGHTIGHAIEAAFSYSRQVTHGEAVAIGMIMASYIALRLKLIKQTDFEKIYSLIKKSAPKTKTRYIKLGKILKALAYDKKFIYGVNRFILPKRIGRVKIVERVPQALIKEAIEKRFFI